MDLETQLKFPRHIAVTLLRLDLILHSDNTKLFDLGLNTGLPEYWRILYPLGQWSSLKSIYFIINTEHSLIMNIVTKITIYNSSNWGQKSKTRVSYWWSCISLFAHVFSVKTSTYSPTWKLKRNKCTRKYSKKGNTPRKWWFKSNQFKRIHVLTSFCLARDPQRKTSVLHAHQFEKDWIRASRCSGQKFLLHLSPGSDRCGRQSSI